MEVNKKELQNILSLLRPGLNKKELAEQSSHFIFFKDKIAVFNDKICITHPFESEDVFSIKGDEFYRLISGISDDTVTLTVVDNKIKIKSKGTSSTMSLLQEDQQSISEKIEVLEKRMKPPKPLPPDFTTALSLCGFTASSDLTQGVRACVCIKDNLCCSTDGYRASKYELSEPLEDVLHIPAKSALELSKFPVVEYCFSDKWACFKTEEGVIFSCSLISGEFPFEKAVSFFDELDGLTTIELPSELKQVVDETLMLASEDSAHSGKIVTLHFENNELNVSANNNLGNVSKMIEMDFEEEPIDLEINSNFLSQILNKSTEMYVGDKIFFITPEFQYLMTKRNVKATK
jgi:DNA polymerase III sliding clamp (beta) subunit (PCNA family)